MFKITQNTLRRFSLAEVLLMVAINHAEDRRNHSATCRKAVNKDTAH